MQRLFSVIFIINSIFCIAMQGVFAADVPRIGTGTVPTDSIYEGPMGKLLDSYGVEGRARVLDTWKEETVTQSKFSKAFYPNRTVEEIRNGINENLVKMGVPLEKLQ